ncbi:hypothetical protein ACFLTT_01000 [Chloroflexota bacterium]
MIYKGTHGKHPKVRMEKAEKVTVKSSERVLVHADGELLGGKDRHPSVLCPLL